MKCAIAGLIGAVFAVVIFSFANAQKPKDFGAGSDFNELARAMADARYEETMLSMGSLTPGLALMFWRSGDGTLIVYYNHKTSRIVMIEYRLVGEGSRRSRTEFRLRVRRLEPSTRRMTIEPYTGPWW